VVDPGAGGRNDVMDSRLSRDLQGRERGPLAGLSGILQDPPDARGRVRLLMKLLNRDLRVMVPLEHVKSEWVIATTAERS